MKTAYGIVTRLFNGAILIQEYLDLFSDRDVAIKTLDKLRTLDADGNNDDLFGVTRELKEYDMMETENDVAILKE